MTTYVSNYTALLDPKTGGDFSNYGGDFRGSPVFITYSFLTDSEAAKESKIYGTDYYKGYTEAQKAVFRATIADLEASSAIKFIEVDDPKYAAINAYVAHGSNYGGWGSILDADRNNTQNGINVTDARAFRSLSRAKEVIAHELGHNLGLKHPHEGNIQLHSSVDNNAHTIMSYNGSGFNGSAPYQEFDKAAFKFLYGSDINFSSRLYYRWDDASGRFTVTGSSGGDKIYGVDAYNVLYGGSGNDLVIGRDFADYIYGGNNDDRIYGGAGNDSLHGGNGNDRLYGDSGTDTLYGGGGNDRFYAGAGSDKYYGGSGNDTLSHAESSYGAYLNLNSGVLVSSIERIEGSKHNDYFYGDNSANYLFGLDGNDNFYGGGGDDKLYGDSGNDNLNGGDGNDVLFGGSGTDRVYGGEGNDWMGADGRSDYFHGGNGVDTVTYYGATSGVYIDLRKSAQSNGDTLYSVENLNGSNKGGDTLIGNGVANKLSGNGGNDRLLGDAGNDVLYGGSGADRIYGGDGNDWMGADGRSDYFHGGNGVDTVTYYGAASGVSIDLKKSAQSNGDTLYSVENLYGSNKGNDTLIGNGVANKLTGNGGNDRLWGDAGNDVLFGGTGRDYHYGGEGDDWMGADGSYDYFHGGNGVDTVTYYGAARGVSIDLRKSAQSNGDTLISVENLNGSNKGGDTLIGNSAANKFWGQGGNDRLLGDAGNDVLYGGTGRDYIYGGEGNDWMGGDGSSDYFHGGNGVDTVTYYGATSGVWIDLKKSAQSNGDTLYSVENLYGSNTGNDTLFGNSGANKLIGNGGNDRLTGEAGDDSLYGGEGRDHLFGGDGNDLMGADGSSDYFYGGSGVDTVTYQAASRGVYIDLKKSTQSNGDTLFSVENLYGSNEGSDTLIGNSEANKLIGNGGNDRLTGEAGNDVLFGGDGRDYIYGGDGDDWMGADGSYDYFDGGSGTDTVTYYGAASGVYRDLRKTTQSNGDTLISVENLNGSNKGGDTLIGNDAANKFWGQGGNDNLYGGDGDDTLYGGTGDDLLYGGAGDDVFVFGRGHDLDRIADLQKGTGSSGHDVIRIDVDGFDDFADVQGAMSQSGASVAINFGSGDALTLNNTTIAQLNNDMFDFV